MTSHFITQEDYWVLNIHRHTDLETQDVEAWSPAVTCPLVLIKWWGPVSTDVQLRRDPEPAGGIRRPIRPRGCTGFSRRSWRMWLVSCQVPLHKWRWAAAALCWRCEENIQGFTTTLQHTDFLESWRIILAFTTVKQLVMRHWRKSIHPSNGEQTRALLKPAAMDRLTVWSVYVYMAPFHCLVFRAICQQALTKKDGIYCRDHSPVSGQTCVKWMFMVHHERASLCEVAGNMKMFLDVLEPHWCHRDNGHL